mgnify:CR=1 FL=1
MLRVLVLLLLLANAVFYGWTRGWLDDVVGVRASGDREPGRLAKQVSPERVRVVSPGARGTGAGTGSDARTATGATALATPVSAGTATAAAPAACIEVGPFSPAQLASATSALEGILPPDRIEDVRRETPAVWIVFMGPYPDADTRRAKGDELRRLRVAHEDVLQVPELGDGLALGRFDTRAAAERALAELPARGVRTARLAQYAGAVVTHTLRARGISTEQQVQAQALQAPGLAGRAVVPCTPA